MAALDLSRLGPPSEQKARFASMLRDAKRGGAKPIIIVRAGRGDWRVFVLGVDIGSVTNENTARAAAEHLAHYRFGVGMFQVSLDAAIGTGKLA